MKKRRLVIFAVLSSVFVGGTILSLQKQNLFLQGIQQKK